MSKPYVGQGWANSIESLGEYKYCHLYEGNDDYERDEDWDDDIPDLEYALEQAEYWMDR